MKNSVKIGSILLLSMVAFAAMSFITTPKTSDTKKPGTSKVIDAPVNYPYECHKCGFKGIYITCPVCGSTCSPVVII